MALTYSAIGVVYGDVGTSPLYVFSSTFTENTPTETDVMGAMSIIFWTITLIVVVKYMLIVLLADDNGEGKMSATLSVVHLESCSPNCIDRLCSQTAPKSIVAKAYCRCRLGLHSPYTSAQTLRLLATNSCMHVHMSHAQHQGLHAQICLPVCVCLI